MSETSTETQSSGVPTPEQLGFDPAELRKKYAAERERRLREDGNNQYREITGASSVTTPTRTSIRDSPVPPCRNSSTR